MKQKIIESIIKIIKKVKSLKILLKQKLKNKKKIYYIIKNIKL